MLKPGDPAPDFEAIDHNGNRVRLRDLRGKKVVLWVTSASLPTLRSLMLAVVALKLQARAEATSSPSPSKRLTLFLVKGGTLLASRVS